MRETLKRTFAALMAAVMVALLIPQGAYCKEKVETITVNVNGQMNSVSAISYGYDRNYYLSMRDMSVAMRGTSKEFVVELTKDEDDESLFILRRPGADDEIDADSVGDQGETGDDGFRWMDVTRKKMHIEIEGHTYAFYVIPHKCDDGEWDVYVSLGEFALAMNMQAEYNDGLLCIYTENEFDLNGRDSLTGDFYYMADSCLVGDATTGAIYTESNADTVIAIASTTKLMTYLVIKDAMVRGEISESDVVTFSANAQALADTSSGVVKVKAGDRANIMDVIKAMLICSSNECSLALAEHLCGSEAEFVKRMNAKAAELELSADAKFFNPHGLPCYSNDVLNAKLQNHLTARDMFRLASHILNTYPEITEITSIKKEKLQSLSDFKAVNTNNLLYNVENCVGLKTGTTDKAQYCLVSASTVQDMNGQTHYLVAVVYGAESVQAQSYTSMVLQRIALQKFNARELGITPAKNDENYVPETLEELIGGVLNRAR